MGREVTEEKQSIHEEALELYDISIQADSINRENQREDIRFIGPAPYTW